MRIATLFSGIGAPEQAAKRVWADHKIIFACEIDKFARQSYLANYDINEKHFYKDIRELDGTKYRGEVDLFVWGFPCQDYSIAGKRAGLKGQRGTLFYEGARITKEVQPRYFVAENVKGLLSTNGGKDFETIMHILREDVGYYCTWAVLNTKDYGVPQNRERVFIVGFKDYNEYIRFEFPKPAKLEKRLKDILEDEVGEKYYLSQKMLDGFMKHNDNHRKKGTGFIYKPKSGDDIANCLRANGSLAPTDNTVKVGFINQDTQASSVYDTSGTSPTVCAGTHGYALGYVQEPTVKVVGKLNIKGADQIKRVYGTDGIAATLTTMQGGMQEPKIQQNYRIRKLTPRECLRLQDFPDDFKIVVSDTQAYKQAGNSMSVNVVEAIFREIDKVRKGKTKTLF